MERLQKIISAMGLASRREAERLIAQGKVTVNGKRAEIGDKADIQKDRIAVDGKPLSAPPKKMYIMLNKPRGYVTTLSDEKGRKTVIDLVKDCGERVYPVGRLDMDSEGLLLLTNDGAFAQRLAHPSHETEKEYLVRVEGDARDKLKELGRPVDIDGRIVTPKRVELASFRDGMTLIRVVITDGRNREVRRMCEEAELNVLRLRRIREGELELGKLPSGSWRPLSRSEISSLKK